MIPQPDVDDAVRRLQGDYSYLLDRLDAAATRQDLAEFVDAAQTLWAATNSSKDRKAMLLDFHARLPGIFDKMGVRTLEEAQEWLRTGVRADRGELALQSMLRQGKRR